MMKPGREKPIAPFAEGVNIYNRQFYIESYGCAMNFSDSEIVASILQEGALAPQEILKKQILFF